jgi:hypothetical protein
LDLFREVAPFSKAGPFGGLWKGEGTTPATAACITVSKDIFLTYDTYGAKVVLKPQVSGGYNGRMFPGHDPKCLTAGGEITYGVAGWAGVSVSGMLPIVGSSTSIIGFSVKIDL